MIDCLLVGKEKKDDKPKEKKVYDMNDPKIREEIHEITKIFEMYDTDGQGT
jgi:hypothetical protein